MPKTNNKIRLNLLRKNKIILSTVFLIIILIILVIFYLNNHKKSLSQQTSPNLTPISERDNNQEIKKIREAKNYDFIGDISLHNPDDLPYGYSIFQYEPKRFRIKFPASPEKFESEEFITEATPQTVSLYAYDDNGYRYTLDIITRKAPFVDYTEQVGELYSLKNSLQNSGLELSQFSFTKFHNYTAVTISGSNKSNHQFAGIAFTTENQLYIISIIQNGPDNTYFLRFANSFAFLDH